MSDAEDGNDANQEDDGTVGFVEIEEDDVFDEVRLSIAGELAEFLDSGLCNLFRGVPIGAISSLDSLAGRSLHRAQKVRRYAANLVEIDGFSCAYNSP